MRLVWDGPDEVILPRCMFGFVFLAFAVFLEWLGFVMVEADFWACLFSVFWLLIFFFGRGLVDLLLLWVM